MGKLPKDKKNKYMEGGTQNHRKWKRAAPPLEDVLGEGGLGRLIGQKEGKRERGGGPSGTRDQLRGEKNLR